MLAHQRVQPADSKSADGDADKSSTEKVEQEPWSRSFKSIGSIILNSVGVLTVSMVIPIMFATVLAPDNLDRTTGIYKFEGWLYGADYGLVRFPLMLFFVITQLYINTGEHALKAKTLKWAIGGVALAACTYLPINPIPLNRDRLASTTVLITTAFGTMYAKSCATLANDHSVTKALPAVFMTLGFFYLASKQTNFTANVKRLESEEAKLLWTLVLFPTFREVGYFMVRSASSYLKPENNILTFYTFMAYANWLGRFLLTSMNTAEGAAIAVIGQTLVELTLRMTFTKRDEFVYQYLLCKGSEKTKTNFNDAQYMANRNKQRAQLLVGELFAEYVPLLGTPLVILLCHKQRMWMDFGYSSYEDEPEAAFLLLSMLAQLVAEVMVDVVCWRYERKEGVDCTAVWEQRRSMFFAAACGDGFFAMIIFMATYYRYPRNDCTESINYMCMCNEDFKYHLQSQFCAEWRNSTYGLNIIAQNQTWT